MVFDIVNDDMESRDNVFEKGTGTLLGQNKSDGTKFQLTIDDVSCTKAEGTIIYVDIPEDYGSLVRTERTERDFG